MIDIGRVEKLALLALTAQEREAAGENLEALASMAGELPKPLGAQEPCAAPTPLRADEITASAPLPEIMQNADKTRDGFFLIEI